MPGVCGLAMLYQGDSYANDVHLITIFAGIIAGCLLLQALGVVFISFRSLRATREGLNLVRDLVSKTTPVLDRTATLLVELGPKVQTIVANAEQSSYTIRGQVEELSATVSELNQTALLINQRARTHAGHVDRMVGSALNATEDIQRTVQDSVRMPVRQAAAMIAGLRAAVDTWIRRTLS